MPEEHIAPVVLRPAELLADQPGQGPIWSHTTEQLNVNLLQFRQGQGAAAHINNEVDVLGVVVTGEALLTIGDQEHRVGPGDTFVIPRGAQRSITALSPSFSYLSCHRRRPGLMPTFPVARGGHPE